MYNKEIKDDASLKKAQELADIFAEQEGRRPRIMIAEMGKASHDHGTKILATGFADVGFDVDIGSLFQTAKEVAKQAIENDVHVLGISVQIIDYKTLVPQIIEELKKYGCDYIMVIVCGVIPKQDYPFLLNVGTTCIFDPDTKISDTAIEILEILIE
ncbi:methylmalonyl-CoA mutase cobalamin-binding domain/chain [Mariniflexile fucanivorans]|uniref:Methylmalonyl-CoA mutase cobalamin-binding domain/chain n=1 Tax=Mariniflexile fucanivorans TaxID=264023 RepID=A0A4R1RM47_9FLAO|nr:methylmalonyl-CoA mutase cobalamin-binding domain/chain [Mariniflexile fucanivorans]